MRALNNDSIATRNLQLEVFCCNSILSESIDIDITKFVFALFLSALTLGDEDSQRSTS